MDEIMKPSSVLVLSHCTIFVSPLETLTKSLENTHEISIFMVRSSVKCKLSRGENRQKSSTISAWRTHPTHLQGFFLGERLVSEFKVISPRNSSSFGVEQESPGGGGFTTCLNVHLQGLG